jgi:hypothetical protein
VIEASSKNKNAAAASPSSIGAWTTRISRPQCTLTHPQLPSPNLHAPWLALGLALLVPADSNLTQKTHSQTASPLLPPSLPNSNHAGLPPCAGPGGQHTSLFRAPFHERRGRPCHKLPDQQVRVIWACQRGESSAWSSWGRGKYPSPNTLPTYSHPTPRRMAVTMEGEVASVTKDAESKMKKCVDSTDNNLKAIRTGRAS